MFKTINQNASGEIVEKKSKFIANIFYVESVEEAEEKVKEVKKQYFDARHNCYAFSIYTKDGIINRFSDDGEPSGTAGAPMLNILNSKNLTNVLVVVTRYFGGILLGTGGLVRCYTGATQEALNSIEEVEKDIGLETKIEVSYSDFEKFKYYLKQNDVFKKIKGLWIGNYEHESGISLEKIILDTIGEEYDFPIIKSNNFGHVDTKTVIPIGSKAKIDTNEDVKIKLIEECVK